MKNITDDIMSHHTAGEKFIISAIEVKKIYENMYFDFMEEYDLTQNEIDVLLFLWKNEKYDTARDIAEYHHLSRSLISKSVDGLSRKGLLCIVQDRQDRRFIHLKLSSDAKEITNKLFKIEEKFYKSLQKDISQDELKVFLSVLRKIRKNIRKEADQID